MPATPLTRFVALALAGSGIGLLWVPTDPPAYVAAPAAVQPSDSTTWVFDLKDNLEARSLALTEELLGLDLVLVADSAADAGIYTATVPVGFVLPEATFVVAAEPEATYSIDGLPAGPDHLGYPNDPGAAAQWNLGLIDAAAGWRAGAGKGVVVAVIDTGVTPNADLLNLLPGRSFVPGSPSSADPHGHGTHVAGTIAQATHNSIGVAGIAPKALILPMRVLDERGAGQTSWIAAAIDAAADDGAQVINLSLGGPPSAVLREAVERAHERGVVVVAAAGNAGREGLGSPADAEHAIAVSAVGPSGELTGYSSWGEGVEIAAPGGDTRITGGGITQVLPEGEGVQLRAMQGTSMASPHVAGAVAVLLGMGASPDEAVATLLKHASPHEDALRYGAGSLDLGSAVRAFLVAKRGLLFGVGAALGLAITLVARLQGWRRVTTVLSAGATAGGLFFLPLLPLPPSEVVLTLARPFQEWPTAAFLGIRLAGFPLWQSALLPLVAVLVFAPSRRLGSLAVGLATGVGTYLLYGAATQDIPLWLPMVWGSTWLAINGTLALVIALAGAGMLRMRTA